jgi:outer membrane lipoprotein SlyB
MQYLLLPQRTLGGQLAAVLASLLLVSACVNPSKGVYQGHDVGRMIDTTEATVVSSRIVKIREESRGYGPLAGAAVGATGTGLASRGSRNAGWLIALGALAGAGVGLIAEQTGRSRDGIEYLVRTSDGRMMTLVQNRDPAEIPIPAGTPVLVQHAGTYTRVIEKPEPLEDQWRNPDAPGSRGTGGGDVQPRGGAPAGSVPAGQMPGGAPSTDPSASRAGPPVMKAGSANAPDQ